MCGVIDDATDTLGDIFNDPVNTVSKGVGTVANAVGDAGQFVGDAVGNAWQGAYNNLDDIWKQGYELANNNLETLQKGAMQASSTDYKDVFAVGKYQKLLDEQLNKDNEIGDDLFGDGGWIHGGMNAIGYYTGYGPIGDYYYQATDAAQGREYSGGKTQPYNNLYSMANTGYKIYNGVTSGGDLATDSNTYTEGTSNGGTTTVSPSDYYASGSQGASSLTTGNKPMDQYDSAYTQSPYVGNTTNLPPIESGDTGQLYLQSPELNASDAYSNMQGDPNYALNPSSGYSPGGPGYVDQARDFLNSNLGKATRVGVSVANPALGTILNGVTTGLNGNLGRAAFDTLGSLYMNNRAARANRQYQDQMNSYMDRMNNMYSPNSAYAQQMRQQLERKDAAAGRRSQYGERETQLQALLAEKQAGLAPMQNILTSQAMQNSIAQQQAARSRQVADLKSIFTPATPGGSSQGSGSNALQSGWDAIKSVWGDL